MARRQVPDFEQFHHLARLALHLRGHRVVGPYAHAAEEPGERDFVARVVARAHLHPVVGHDAEVMPQVEQAPLVAPQDAQRPGFGLQDRVQVARDQLDQRRFAAPVGPQNRDMLALRDRERDTVQRHPLLAPHCDVFQFDKGNQLSILVADQTAPHLSPYPPNVGMPTLPALFSAASSYSRYPKRWSATGGLKSNSEYCKWETFFRTCLRVKKSASLSPADSIPAPPSTGCVPKVPFRLPTPQTSASPTSPITTKSPAAPCSTAPNARGSSIAANNWLPRGLRRCSRAHFKSRQPAGTTSTRRPSGAPSRAPCS